MSRTIEGVVQGGVVVPTAPLPEGARVEIVLPEQNPQSNGGAPMTPAVPVLDASVQEFLKRHDAEADYRTYCALVRESFPELVRLEVTLENDPDEEGRQQLVLWVYMPDSISDEILDRQEAHYHQRFFGEVPHAKSPLFVTLTRFA